MVMLKIQWYAWWKLHSVEAIALGHALKPDHANWLEAFPFTMVGRPAGRAEVSPPRVPLGRHGCPDRPQVYGDGSFGGPYRPPEGIIAGKFLSPAWRILCRF